MKLRPFVDADLPGCGEVYSANLKKGLIPDHYEHEFLDALKDTEILTLVAEVDGEIIGCGSVSYTENYLYANLSFGLIHPEHQRRGFGSQLLVGRIALLVENEGHCTIYLCATENSVGFYGRVVGFGEYKREVDEYGNQFYWLHLPLNYELLQQSQAYIRDEAVEMAQGLAVPIKSQHAEERAGHTPA